MRTLISLLIIAIVVVALIFGRDLLIPIVLAFLCVTLISAASERLQSVGLSSRMAVIAALLAFATGAVVIVSILAGQADDVANAWPRYVERFELLASQFAAYAGPEVAQKLREALQGFRLAQLLPGLAGSASGILGSLILVLLYVGFMLVERGEGARKIQLVFSTREESDRLRATLDSIVDGIRNYVWIKTIVSVVTGLVSYVVLSVVGVDFAAIWALLIFLLNYIPNVGSVLGVIFPALIALVQFDTLWPFLIIAGLLTAVQFVLGNVIEPMIMGKTLNLSPIVIMVSLVFWGTIWGIPGAFLSVPLTSAIAITCSKLESWRWLAVLLSSDGVVEANPSNPNS